MTPEPATGTAADGPASPATPVPGRQARPAAARRGGTGAATRADVRADAEPAVHGRGAARKFVGRLAQLDLEAVRAAVAAWRQLMAEESPAWYAAEEAVGRALVVSGRSDEQRPLLIHVADAFCRLVWYGGRTRLVEGESAPELRGQATEASGQYLATLAMLALLVRDHLEPAAFALLYGPFAPLIPVADLARE